MQKKIIEKETAQWRKKRYEVLETSQPDLDYIGTIIYPKERIVFLNKSAKDNNNVIYIRRRTA